MKQKIGIFFLHYLRFFARLQLKKIKFIQNHRNQPLIIIGITGSAGKTSALLATKAALTPNFVVKTNYGGNSESGIPLSILDLKNPDFSLISWIKIALLAPLKILTDWSAYQIFLVEMGIDSQHSPKNMDYLLSIVKPQIGVFLNVSPVHLENFSSVDQIAFEKAKLVNSAETAIINTTDPLVKKYTTNPNTISLPSSIVKLKNFLLPDIYQESLQVGLTIAKILKIDQSTALKNLNQNFELPPSRASVLTGIHNSTIIDSSYNSSPIAATKMLEFLKSFSTPKIAILGDMRELGEASLQAHQKLYQMALDSADIIISVGPQTSRYFGSKAKKFLYYWQVNDYLTNNPDIIKNSTILVKGSQNTIYLEEVVKKLLKNSVDRHQLCRQSPYWLKLKSDFHHRFDL